MSRKAFGQLVAALRKEHSDEEANVWTQEKLGEETGLGALLIGKIERGEKASLDADILVKLAAALHLTSMERREFFLAATALENHALAREDGDPEEMLAFLLRVIKELPMPAFVYDAYLDIIAANGVMLQFLGLKPEALRRMAASSSGANVMRVIFAPETGFRDLLGAQWHATVARNIQFFRSTTLRYRASARFARTLKALRKLRWFKRYWAETHFEEGDDCWHLEHYDYRHPTCGRVTYLALAIPAITHINKLYLTLFVPANGRTAQAFADIGAEVGAEVHRFAPWPGQGSDA